MGDHSGKGASCETEAPFIVAIIVCGRLVTSASSGELMRTTTSLTFDILIIKRILIEAEISELGGDV